MRKTLAVVLVLVMMSLTGCTVRLVDMTEMTVMRLQTTELYYAYGVKSINLKAMSKCALPPTVNIVNAETRVDSGINPKELMNGVVDYLKYGFEKSKVQIDSNSSKIIRLSLKEVNHEGTPLTGSKGYIQIIVDIPEIKYMETYEAHDRTGGDSGRAIAYAIHVVTRQIIDAQNIQDYVLCR